jgi:hypothetical protein
MLLLDTCVKIYKFIDFIRISLWYFYFIWLKDPLNLINQTIKFDGYSVLIVFAETIDNGEQVHLLLNFFWRCLRISDQTYQMLNYYLKNKKIRCNCICILPDTWIVVSTLLYINDGKILHSSRSNLCTHPMSFQIIDLESIMKNVINCDK